jgi:hypothetical protein
LGVSGVKLESPMQMRLSLNIIHSGKWVGYLQKKGTVSRPLAMTTDKENLFSVFTFVNLVTATDFHKIVDVEGTPPFLVTVKVGNDGSVRKLVNAT